MMTYRITTQHNKSDSEQNIVITNIREELINIAYLVDDLLNDNPELYTYHNTHIGCIQNDDSPAFNLD